MCTKVHTSNHYIAQPRISEYRNALNKVRMKNILISVLLLAFPLPFINVAYKIQAHYQQATTSSVYNTAKVMPLYDVIAMVESKQNPRAIGSQGSLGYLQIRPALVQDVNSIKHRKGSSQRYTHEDALSQEKSVEMFMTYTNFYLDYNRKPRTIDNVCALWNSGPQMSLSKTQEYRSKIWSAVRNFEAKGYIIALENS